MKKPLALNKQFVNIPGLIIVKTVLFVNLFFLRVRNSMNETPDTLTVCRSTYCRHSYIHEISSDIAKRGNPTNLGSKKGGKGFKRGIPTIVGSK